MEQRAAVDAPGLKTLLGVTRSIMGRHWVERATNHSEVMNIAQRVRIHGQVRDALHQAAIGSGQDAAGAITSLQLAQVQGQIGQIEHLIAAQGRA